MKVRVSKIKNNLIRDERSDEEKVEKKDTKTISVSKLIKPIVTK